jgi:lipopolysaccharide/colanic/teichoic acid biosynthesis glycosyltransferase
MDMVKIRATVCLSEETYAKLQYDLFYIKGMIWFLALAILLKTIRIVLFGWGR